METLPQNTELLERALKCWHELQSFRDTRERCKRFTYGDQWNDTIEDRGLQMTEEEFIRSQGNFPLKNNLIRRLVRNVLGVFRNSYSTPLVNDDDLAGLDFFDKLPSELAAMRLKEINQKLKRSARLNRLDELYARTMEEFLISGLAVHKKWHGRREGRVACWTDNVSPTRFFFDTDSRDFRGFDLCLVGEIHELTPDDLLGWKRCKAVDAFRDRASKTPTSGDARFRVIEVWQRRRAAVLHCHDYSTGRFFKADPVEADRLRSRHGDTLAMSRAVDEWWEYSFLTPDGVVLDSGRSPYAHGSHPYAFKAYPFIDGEIHSFVADIIDQQKLTNRLISMYDWILRASAKGVLLFPEGALPEGTDINDIADEWSRFNGVIVYRPRAGVPLPQQVSSKSADIGITELLEIQMKMMEDISGVNGALQGKLESGTISGTLYSQQTQNSMTALADLLASFADFMQQATLKETKLLSNFEF